MANWKNLLVNPPRNKGSFLFKVESKENFNKDGKPRLRYVYGFLIHEKDEIPKEIIYRKEQTFSMGNPDICLTHTIDPKKYNYKYLDLREIL